MSPLPSPLSLSLSLSLLLLGACTGRGGHPGADPGATGGPDTGEHAGSGRGPVALPRLVEAEDLDPAEEVLHVRLVAAPQTHTFVDLEGEVHTVEGFAYNGLLPGPLLRATRGDTVIVELENRLDEPTTLHWHGLEVPFAMDGVDWMESPVAVGETRTYAFTVSQAGTFWYHPHFNSDAQVSGGLLGAIVIEDPADPVPDHDIPLVIQDWPLGGEGAATATTDHLAMEGVWTVNGAILPTLSLPSGEVARLRVLNASTLGYAALSWPEMRQIGGDQGVGGGLLSPERVVLAPGDRAEWEVLLSEGFSVWDEPYVHQGGAAYGAAEELLRVEVTGAGAGAGPVGLPWPFHGEGPSADPGYTDVTYVFSGSRETGVWMINGEVFPEITIAEAARGETVIVEVRNLSPAEHPYHLHGLSFEVLSVDGVVPAHRQIEDTVNVGLYGAVRLRIVANNPGDWMSHCHILPHAEGGMMTVLRVE